MAEFIHRTRKGRRRDLWITVVVLLVAVALLLMPAAYKREVRSAVRGTVLWPFVEAQEVVAEQARPGLDPDALLTERDSLAAVVAAQSLLAEENRRLRGLLALRERVPEQFVPAEVLKLGVLGAESTFLLNVGRAEGVMPGSAVVSSGGLLGRVWTVDEHTAQGIDWTHPEFRASAMTATGDAYGIVEPRRGRFREADLLALTGAPFHVDIPVGTRVVTSGRGGLLPRGIPLGTVIAIEEADTGWRKSYLLRPAVRPEAATHVLVGTQVEGVGVDDLSEAWHTEAPPDPLRAPQADTTRAAAPAETGSS